MQSQSTTTFATRLLSFHDQWPTHQTTARQLAALGHICDRPPLESLEEGSRCVDCGLFLTKHCSVEALEGSLTSKPFFASHKPKCPRLQIRMPLEPSRSTLDYSSLANRWEKRSRLAAVAASTTTSLHPPAEPPKPSPLLSLPAELRLQIYAYILPSPSPTTEIVPLHRDSTRTTTKANLSRPTSPREHKANTNTTTSLLLTCKALHHEVLDHLYAHTTFKPPQHAPSTSSSATSGTRAGRRCEPSTWRAGRGRTRLRLRCWGRVGS